MSGKSVFSTCFFHGGVHSSDNIHMTSTSQLERSCMSASTKNREQVLCKHTDTSATYHNARKTWWMNLKTWLLIYTIYFFCMLCAFPALRWQCVKIERTTRMQKIPCCSWHRKQNSEGWKPQGFSCWQKYCYFS